MSNLASSFFTITVLLLVLVAIVFAMKYGAAAYRSHLDARRRTSTEEVVDGLSKEVGDLTKRVAAVERLLREVE